VLNLDAAGALDARDERLGLRGEQMAELVAGPLDAVQRVFREHFQRALRDVALFLRVLRGLVALGLEGKYDLHVALGAQRAALEQRHLGGHAAHVHVPSGLHVVERVHDHVLRLEEQVRENVVAPVEHLVLHRVWNYYINLCGFLGWRSSAARRLPP